MSWRASGFTIIELMVAMVIFMLFMGAVFGVYNAANQSIQVSTDQQEVYQTGRVLLGQLNAELTCAYQQPNATACQLTDTVATDPSSGLPLDTLTFVTTAHPAPAGLPASDLCQVTYEIAGDGSADAPVGLYVAEDFYPGLEMLTYTPTLRLVSPRVIGLNCLYLDSTGNWQNDWSTQTTLPVAVRVELTMQPRTPGAQPFILTTTANLMTAIAAPATTTTGGTSATH